MNKSIIKEQFGANATAYITSQSHAKGASLKRLIELVKTEPDWQALDIATGAGHTAFTFAPHVGQVRATDITPEMLEVTAQQAKKRGLKNITVEHADAEALPYETASFDLVTCRIAPHHFGDVPLFVREAARVLRVGGILAVVDNVVPPGSVGAYINGFEKWRDPSHGRCLSLEEWLDAFTAAGLTLRHHETQGKRMSFDYWAKRHDPIMQQYLHALLTQSSPDVAAFFQPQVTDDDTTFRLCEGIMIGRKEA